MMDSVVQPTIDAHGSFERGGGSDMRQRTSLVGKGSFVNNSLSIASHEAEPSGSAV
jgi:hypothetical protein